MHILQSLREKQKRKKKRGFQLPMILLGIAVLAAGCSANKDLVNTDEKIRPVKVLELREEEYPIHLEYIGIVTSRDMKNYSFKSGGKIQEIYVQEGQLIQKGDPIAKLDPKDMQFALDGAKNQMDAAKGQVDAANGQLSAAKAQYEKALNGAQIEDVNAAKISVEQAEAAYQFAADRYQDVSALYETGGASKLQLDEVKLQMDNAEKSYKAAEETYQKVQSGARKEDIAAALAQYEAARGQHTAAVEQYNAAKVQYDSQKSMLEEGLLVSDTDGYVMKLPYKAGELIGSGYPVAVVRADRQVVNIGVSQKDVRKIEVGAKATVQVDELTIEGTVSNIEQVPDEATRTFLVEIELPETAAKDKIYLGSIAKTSIGIGTNTGIWLDIQNIINDGEDYVYVVEENRAVRKDLTIQKVYEDKVSVEGLHPQDLLVIEGASNLKAGYQVKIVE